ncbi:MAG TPA: adenosine deaminase [Patescibacteria group bacterium]|nr:adenosine deaminase [Patescibacteria group bacterium]
MGLNLHCHLEGCVRPDTAAAIGAARGVPEPVGGWEAALRMRTPADLTVFLEHVAAAYPVMGFADALRRIAREAVEDAAGAGEDFLEIRFGPATHRRADLPIVDVIRAVRDGLADGSAATGIPTGLVICLLRHSDRDTNLEVAAAAAALAGDGVHGLDVAGDELRWPSNEPFVEAYRIAAAAGLGLTAHAAEASGPGAAREAAEWLGATRIGHGSHVADDPEVLAWAADHGLTFEVCATSNVYTGAARSLAKHPLHAFIAAGAGVVLGDDNPITIDRTLADEERDLVAEGGLSPDVLRAIQRRSVDVGFMDESVRSRLREQLAGLASP